jgi:hypothetical protein
VALETFISPEKGPSISRIRKTEAATDRAHTTRTAVTVALRGANRPKLAKINASQNTTTTQHQREMSSGEHRQASAASP